MPKQQYAVIFLRTIITTKARYKRGVIRAKMHSSRDTTTLAQRGNLTVEK
jgi:hypothetical protein